MILFLQLTVVKTEAIEPVYIDSATLASNNFVESDFHIQKQAIENILKKNDSILFNYAHDYLMASYAYNLDPYLLVSISGLESSFGSRMKRNTYNAYGWGGGHLAFESWPHGIFTISKSLRFKYLNRGAKTIDDIGKIYAESPTWSIRVKKIIAKFNQEELRLRRLSYLL
ncbi:hypothetical protein A3J15_01465 [Candidatus Roizmanbacteria bacterium RIFCSPLOWO2_02_FULL_38_10]|uniref:Mannosyl-glycoprotein endo-beta-N-acetylglucosamidase-like domain-containing protein n=1 Tax=Candidatus Roizmanbacteria bacterium RIFCSPLOWO2_02_FULL_38_10 TaxID=1802074 RepID=A0A1F7JP49_9BACT|nr:MAG: hypothetical protein A3J15_01465 [Candidatus Roizmanbacteria bacterium RIFCSPLOWO2_02_FULL_38_10]